MSHPMRSRRSFVSKLTGAAAGSLLVPRRAAALVTADAARPSIAARRHGRRRDRRPRDRLEPDRPAGADGRRVVDARVVRGRAPHGRPGGASRDGLHRPRRPLGPARGPDDRLPRAVPGPRRPPDLEPSGRRPLPDARPASTRARDVRLAWSADTVGQGWGIDLARGGLRSYETMRRLEPDLFVHCGDTIYADNPLAETVPLDDGSVWRNLVTPAKSKVAETLEEFRGNYLYNLLDENVRRFNAEVAQVMLWDDHEVLNNWYPTRDARRPALHGEERGAPRRAREARLPRAQPDPLRRRRPRARLPADPVRAPARRLRDRHAQRARGELAQHPARGRARDGAPGPRAARLAEAGPRALQRRLEGGGERHAARAGGAGRPRRTSRRSRTATPARRSGASWRSPSCCASCASSASATSSGSPATSTTPRPTTTTRSGRASRTSTRSGSSSRARSTPARSGPRRSTRPSAPRCASWASPRA